MASYVKLHAILRESVVADIKKIVDKYVWVVFYDVEGGTTWIDAAVGEKDGNGCYPDVTKISKSKDGRYIVSAIDSEYNTIEYDIDDLCELSTGDLCGLHDAMVHFFEGNQEPKFTDR